MQRGVRKPGDLFERLLETPHQLERPLGVGRFLERMQSRVAGQRRDALVQLGVVLHRARAERVKAGVEVEVALGEAVEVAHDLGLRDLGQAGWLLAPQSGGEQRIQGPLRNVELWRRERAAAGLRSLEDRELVVGRGSEPVLARGGGHACAPAYWWRSAATAPPRTSTSLSISARVRRSVIATSRPSSCSG